MSVSGTLSGNVIDRFGGRWPLTPGLSGPRSPACRSTCGYTSELILMLAGWFRGPMQVEVIAHGRHEADKRARWTGPPENFRCPPGPVVDGAVRDGRRGHAGARRAGVPRRACARYACRARRADRLGRLGAHGGDHDLRAGRERDV